LISESFSALVHVPYRYLVFLKWTCGKVTVTGTYIRYLGCGSVSRLASGLAPDSVTLWSRIRIGNLNPGLGSRSKKIKWKNVLVSYWYLLKKNYN
jgi:hypothetical protein